MKHLINALAVMAVLLLGTVAETSAGPFVVSNADFSGNVYELRYYTSTNLLVQNGVATVQDSTPLTELFITNTGNAGQQAYQYYGADSGVKYFQASGRFGGWGGGANSTWNTSAAATMGFDLSSVSGQVAKVELITRQNIAQFAPWNDEAFGDQVFADIATPVTFGTGAYTNLYTFTGDNLPAGSGPSGYASNSVIDVTSFLSSSWLNNPGNLEFRFGYQLIDTDIPGRHLQLFRDNSFWSPSSGSLVDDSFMLRVTLADTSPVPEPSSIVLLGIGGIALAGYGYRRKRQQAA